MRNSLYPRLAAQNIKKNGKYYLPYIITGILSVAMFYIVLALNQSESIKNISGGPQLQLLISYAMIVGTILFGVFLFYNQSFLIKRRKTEFGLYSVLGMEKKHISKMCAYESLYVSALSIVGGILVGIVFSRLSFLALLKMLKINTPLKFEFNVQTVSITTAVFLGIYTLIFFNTIRQVFTSKTVDLLHSSKVGEKEPKAKWIITLLGVISLGIGYTIALTTKSPMDAIPLFTFAVIMVMVGTYCLFTSGSIHLLKALKKNKNYYYKTKHFVSVSGMIYRMKQNAIGLGNICIFCTAVLVMLSTTGSLYAGMEDILRNRFPRNVAVEVSVQQAESADAFYKSVDEQCDSLNVNRWNTIQYKGVDYATVQKDGNIFSSTNQDRDNVVSMDGITNFHFISLDDYNRFTGKNETLADDEVLLCQVNGEITGDVINFGERQMKIKQRVDDIDLASSQTALLFHTYYVIIPDISTAKSLVDAVTYGEDTIDEYTCYYGFDTNADADAQLKVYHQLNDELSGKYTSYTVECAEESRESFYSLYGGLLFIGVFLGIAFIIATVLIIYYKQISEGYDDKERFEIMQKVGMDKTEIRKSINSQVLTVFFLPLVTAFIHLAVAFPIIVKLLALLNLTNVSLFAVSLVITAAIFAIFYGAVYMLTARIYFKIVK